MFRAISWINSALSSLLRLGSGSRVGQVGPRPERMLELYEFENCPFCRKAREALSILDLDARIYPCPKGGPNYRQELIERGGKAQFPYLIDPNTGTEMYESNQIVSYLFEHYGAARPPILLLPGPQNDLTTMLASMVRPLFVGRGYRKAKRPEQELELFTSEASPAGRQVRELLCTLELPYVLRSAASGGEKASGETPRLVDPNTPSELVGAGPILRHLQTSYAA